MNKIIAKFIDEEGEEIRDRTIIGYCWDDSIPPEKFKKIADWLKQNPRGKVELFAI